MMPLCRDHFYIVSRLVAVIVVSPWRGPEFAVVSIVLGCHVALLYSKFQASWSKFLQNVNILPLISLA
jgi:hypothetical protein